MVNYNKLSDLQKEVLKLLNEGWEGGIFLLTSGYTQVFYRVSLQKNGLGHGSPIMDFRVTVVKALRRKGLVEFYNSHINDVTGFKLTLEGKRIAMLLVDGKCIKNENK
jgi:hypothetical protein